MKHLDPLVNLWPKANPMRGSLQAYDTAAADAYLAWWALAGVDCAVADQPVDWLRPVAVVQRAAATPESAALAPARALPKSLASFHDWLTDEEQPEARWTGARIMPSGPQNAPLMIVTDMPDPADMAAGTMLSGPAGILIDNMLRAIGLARADIYLASLALTRPAGGMIEVADMATLARRMRAHVALAQPRRLLVLGDRTARALDLTDADKDGLRSFNHDGGTVPMIATFHPRLLLSQPAAKAECWRALQDLIEEQRQ